jgi:hypothetical protein
VAFAATAVQMAAVVVAAVAGVRALREQRDPSAVPGAASVTPG